MEYTVIGATKSRALRVLWLLEELDLPYTHIAAAPGSDQVKAYSPLGKIPVLLADDRTLTDSVAIMTFLADAHGAFTYPAGSLERATQDAWTNRILDEMDAVLWAAAKHGFALPEAHRVPDVKVSLRWEFQRNMARIASEMDSSSPFLMGEKPTIADILMAHCSGWAISARFPMEEPLVRGHMDRLRARPAFQTAVGR